jgi:CxxC-x17-CxxC domain-containing protein
MHSATCAECGARCEVPFKPNGEKPVYCNNCFKREERPDSRRSGGRDSGGFGYGGRNESRPSMHEAICDTCGKECEVPFKPTHGKPVYCDNCFGGKSDKSDFKSDFKKPEVSKKEFDQLNTKLDAILKRLDSLMPNKEPNKAKQDAPAKAAKKEEPAVKEESKKDEKKPVVKKIGKKETTKKIKKAK